MSESQSFHKVISKNKFQEIRLRTITYETKPYLDVRIWQRNDQNSHFHPTRHGLTASPKIWKQILAVLQTGRWETLESFPEKSAKGAFTQEPPKVPKMVKEPQSPGFQKMRWNKALQPSGKPLK